MKHLHFGAGSFGLGFVGWLSRELGMDFFLANRATDEATGLSIQNQIISRQRAYILQFNGSDRDAVSVAAFLNFSDPAESRRIEELVADPDTKLITTSLKGGHPAISPLLLQGLLAHPIRDAARF